MSDVSRRILRRLPRAVRYRERIVALVENERRRLVPSAAEEKPFAVFAVVPVGDGLAATTRAADRGEAGRIGLPGGKVDPGETPIAALRREAREEGWELSGAIRLIRKAPVEGRLVHWYSVEAARQLDDYAERGRIRPIVASRQALAASGYGNQFLSDGSASGADPTTTVLSIVRQLSAGYPIVSVLEVVRQSGLTPAQVATALRQLNRDEILQLRAETGTMDFSAEERALLPPASSGKDGFIAYVNLVEKD